MRTLSLPRLAAALLLAGPDAASAAESTASPPNSGIRFDVDCPACGPNQTFPHECPEGVGRLPAAKGPGPLTELLQSLRTHHRRFAALEGVTLPEIGARSTLAALDDSLTSLLTAARGEVARLEQQYAAEASVATELATAAQKLATRRDRLTAVNAALRETLAALEAQTLAAQREAVSAREATIALQKIAPRLREHIRLARNQLLPRLHQADERGWILPPSSYRELPAAPAAKMHDRDQPAPSVRRSDDAPPQNRAATATRETLAVRIGASAAELPELKFEPLSAASGPRDAAAPARAKLHQFAALYYRAATATGARADTRRVSAAAQTEIATLQPHAATLEAEHTALSAARDTRQRQRDQAVQLATDERAQVHDTRERVAALCVKAAVYPWLDRQAAAALAPLLAPGADAARLRALRDVAMLTAQLGADPAMALARLPAELAAREGALDEIRRELGFVRRTLAPDLAFDSTQLSAALRPYFAEPVP